MGVVVVPAKADRFDDVAALLAPCDPDAPACWCLYYRCTSSQFNKFRGAERPAALRSLCEREVAPGVLAYLDGQVVGWCALGPRAEMGRLQRSRTIPAIDDTPVWSIVCFVVRSGFRRQGVAAALLDGAIAYAAEQGATVLESYPIDTEGSRVSGAFLLANQQRVSSSAG
jgi:GNAT superfamily N-acetyltransferase